MILDQSVTLIKMAVVQEVRGTIVRTIIMISTINTEVLLLRCNDRSKSSN